jgi:hypothetical protein
LIFLLLDIRQAFSLSEHHRPFGTLLPVNIGKVLNLIALFLIFRFDDPSVAVLRVVIFRDFRDSKHVFRLIG